MAQLDLLGRFLGDDGSACVDHFDVLYTPAVSVEVDVRINFQAFHIRYRWSQVDVCFGCVGYVLLIV